MTLAAPLFVVCFMLAVAPPATAHFAGFLSGLYPDLRAAVPGHFTVQNDHQRECLRFSNLVANTGQGALRLRPEHDPVTGITTGYQEVFDEGNSNTRNRTYFDCFPGKGNPKVEQVAHSPCTGTPCGAGPNR